MSDRLVGWQISKWIPHLQVVYFEKGYNVLNTKTNELLFKKDCEVVAASGIPGLIVFSVLVERKILQYRTNVYTMDQFIYKKSLFGSGVFDPIEAFGFDGWEVILKNFYT